MIDQEINCSSLSKTIWAERLYNFYFKHQVDYYYDYVKAHKLWEFNNEIYTNDFSSYIWYWEETQLAKR